MDIRFGAQAHPLGGIRFGDQEYAPLTGNAAGYMAAVETGLDVFEAEAEPTIQATLAAVEADHDAFTADGTSNLSQTMQAVEDATPDKLLVFGTVTLGSLRFGDQIHPLGGLRFGSQSWGALGPNGISETLRDTDTGAVLAEETGLIVTVRAASDSEATLYATAAGETDASGVLQFSSGDIGNPGDYVYLSVEKSDNSRVAMFRVQVKDLNSL